MQNGSCSKVDLCVTVRIIINVTNTVIALASQCQPVEQSWSVCIFLGHGVPREQTSHCFGCLGSMLTIRTGRPLGSSWPRKKPSKKRQGAGGTSV